MKKLMAIFAHPDDEGAISGTLRKYADAGVELTLVCATRGEVGEISDPSLATPETLGQVREGELMTAADVLGIRQVRLLDWRDSGMHGTPENEDARAFVQADPQVVIGQIVALIREIQPDIVITFEPFGWYGHPDHIFAGTCATQAYPLAADPDSYPAAGPAFQPQRLYHAVIPFSKFAEVIQEAVAAGYIESFDRPAGLPEEDLKQTEAQVTHVIDVADRFEIKQLARDAHRTQFSPAHPFNKIPKALLIKSSGQEHFIQVHPPPATGLNNARHHDLFE
jgi:LmbE family N-acetylglucosaminyl deacetylase